MRPAALLLVLTLLVGCPDPPGEPQLLVFAAASTASVLPPILEGWDGPGAATSFGPSSGLARHIAEGAPADVYISANRAWIDHLQEAGRLAGEPVVWARNRLVCIAGPDSPLVEAGPIPDAATLLARLEPGQRVAIGVEGVPAGDYARQSLQHARLMAAFEPYLVGQPDVRSVLVAVAATEAVAGFVYRTDVRAAAVEVLYACDPQSHDAIEYLAAPLAQSRDPEAARALVEYLSSEEVRAILEAAGFERP